MAFKLSRGSIKQILDSKNVTDPVIQIISMKNIQNNQDGLTRYKLSLCDGESIHTFGILATQKNEMVDSDELKVGSVLKLTEYASNVLSKDPLKMVVILLNFEILGEMEVQKPGAAAPATANAENVEPNKPAAPPAAKSFYNNKNQEDIKSASVPTKITSSNSSGGGSSAGEASKGTFNNYKIFGIGSLNPYQNKWSIKVRCTNKSNIRTYNNAKGGGRLFNVEFLDSSGEIRCTGFNEAVDKYYEMLEIDSVYYVSRCQLKAANKQYSNMKNDYEMTINNDTVIEQCHEVEDMPHLSVELVPIRDIQDKAANDFVDVIGVVRMTGECTTIVTKAGKELKKRELNLVDSSNYAVSMTLWGDQADKFDGEGSPVLLIKGAKVGDYQGRTIGAAMTSVIQLNPDIDEAHSLRGWYDQGIQDSDITELSGQSNGPGAGGSQASGGGAQYKTLDFLKDDKLIVSDKPEYLTSKVTILYARKENSMYQACAGENCNKKVVDQNDGTFRCEKCQKSYDTFNWRLILSLNIADHADSNWCTLFQEQAEHVLGMTAKEIGDLKSNDDTRYQNLFSDCVFKEYTMKLRAKMETYNDESRVKCSVVALEDVDYLANAKRLLANIKTAVKQNPELE